jgi:hypothetical protein
MLFDWFRGETFEKKTIFVNFQFMRFLYFILNLFCFAFVLRAQGLSTLRAERPLHFSVPEECRGSSARRIVLSRELLH